MCIRDSLNRYEWPSVWETQEVQSRLFELWSESDEKTDDLVCEEGMQNQHDHDSEKSRATMQQYTSIIGQEVAGNLEGLARARLEKHPRAYQTDAEIHESYTKMVYGGEGGAADGEADGDPLPEPGKPARSQVFQPMGKLDDVKQKQNINFQTRTRLNSTTKELLAMPCMQTSADEEAKLAATGQQHRDTRDELQAFHDWASQTHNMKLDVLHQQQESLEIQQDEAVIEEAQPTPHGLLQLPDGLPPSARFVECQDLYRTPSAFIKALVANLPSDERLTRDQTLLTLIHI